MNRDGGDSGLLGCGRWGGHWGVQRSIDLLAVEELVVLEHAEDGVEEFAHSSDQGLHFGFTARQDVVVVDSLLIVKRKIDLRH
jgi:hypothetical protein